MTDKNFEKDINVPSKEKIMYDYNAKDCEQCSSDSVCCYCKNIACYKLEEQLQAKEQECERLKWYLNEIRDDELKTLDIEWGEYETHSFDTEYSNIINLVEEALEERSPEDCKYGK